MQLDEKKLQVFANSTAKVSQMTELPSLPPRSVFDLSQAIGGHPSHPFLELEPFAQVS